MYMCLLCCVFLATFFSGQSFFLEEKADCVLSQWSDWSKGSSYGISYREKKILQYPVQGGKACAGPLIDVREETVVDYSVTQTPLPIPVTATLLIEGFLRPHPNHKRALSQTGLYRDLLVILDASSSIGSSEFRQSVYELTTLLALICPQNATFDSTYNRAALIEFSSSIREIFDFDDLKTNHDVLNAMRHAQYLGRNTCTGNAFNYAETMFRTTKGARNDPNIKREVLILTDGESNCGTDAVIAAQNLHKIADVYALIIGKPNATGSAEIDKYVSRPRSKHLFAAPNKNDLTKLLAEVISQLQANPTVKCAPFYPSG